LRREGIDLVPVGASRFMVTWCEAARPGLLADLRSLVAEARGRVTVFTHSERPVEEVRALLAAGAEHVVPCVDGSMAEAAGHLKAWMDRWDDVDAILASAEVTESIVWRSRAMRRVLEGLIRAAAFSRGPILLLGPTGAGKELLARLVHAVDRRSERRELVVVDCTTLSAELGGSELFGHERGAFTGAIASRDGAFAQAHQGTLFLDEIGELSPPLQAQLLRVLQEKVYKRVGGNHWFESNFRLVSATHRELEDAEAKSAFRTDLFHRLGGWVVRIPPLGERPEDIVPLAEHFLRAHFVDEPPSLDENVQSYLCQRAYPGNVRELRQLVGRIASNHLGRGPIRMGAIAAAEKWSDRLADPQLDAAITRATLGGVGLRELLSDVRRAAIQAAFDACDGKVQQASRLLRVSDRALQLERAKRDGLSVATTGES
jgi:transcriptional regulator with GAF, ATPase, and Fis domain